jgi:type IV secretory pathway VirB10-like protein
LLELPNLFPPLLIQTVQPERAPSPPPAPIPTPIVDPSTKTDFADQLDPSPPAYSESPVDNAEPPPKLPKDSGASEVSDNVWIQGARDALKNLADDWESGDEDDDDDDTLQNEDPLEPEGDGKTENTQSPSVKEQV